MAIRARAQGVKARPAHPARDVHIEGPPGCRQRPAEHAAPAPRPRRSRRPGWASFPRRRTPAPRPRRSGRRSRSWDGLRSRRRSYGRSGERPGLRSVVGFWTSKPEALRVLVGFVDAVDVSGARALARRLSTRDRTSSGSPSNTASTPSGRFVTHPATPRLDACGGWRRGRPRPAPGHATTRRLSFASVTVGSFPWRPDSKPDMSEPAWESTRNRRLLDVLLCPPDNFRWLPTSAISKATLESDDLRSRQGSPAARGDGLRV